MIEKANTKIEQNWRLEEEAQRGMIESFFK